MRVVLMTVVSVALLGCTPAEIEAVRPPERVQRADGPPIVGPTVDAVIAQVQRRPTWVPQTGIEGVEGAWVHTTPGIRALISDRATLLDSQTSAWRADLELSGYGRGQSVEPLAAPAVDAWDDRVTLDRGPVSEWYAHTDRGLEQGFTLEREPAGSGPVRLELTISGDLIPERSGTDIRLVDVDGLTRVRASALAIYDADDAQLPAWFEVDCADADCAIEIWFDDRGARWPIAVDPLYTVELATNPISTAWSHGGYAVDIAQDFAVVGVPDDPADDFASGTALVLGRNQSGPDSWTFNAEIRPGLPVPQSYGRAVSIDGHTAAVAAPLGNKVYLFAYDGSSWVDDGTIDGGTNSFGHSLDLHEDQLAIGAPDANVPFQQQGFVWVVERDIGGTWGPHVQIVAPSPAPGMRFGENVAIRGDRLMVGTPGASGGAGEFYPFHKDASGWTASVQGTGLPGALLGTSIAMTGDRMVAGAPGVLGGSVIVASNWVSNPGQNEWGALLTLYAPPGASEYGTSVATDEDYVAVSGFAETAAGRVGRVWVYLGNGMSLVDTIAVPSASLYAPRVAMDTGLLMVGMPEAGAQGEIAVYRLDGDSWTSSTFTLNDGGGISGASRAGSSVGISGNRLAVGLPYDDTVGIDSGAVYVLDRQTDAAGVSTWTYDRTYTHPTPNATGVDRFGAQLAMHENWLAVGAPGHGDAYPSVGAGSAHLFNLEADSTAQMAEATYGGGGASLGSSLALSNSLWVAGASGGDLVRVYELDGLSASFVQNIYGTAGSNFGRSMALSDRWLVIGATTDDTAGTNAGAAYAYDLQAVAGLGQPPEVLLGSSPGELFGRSLAIGDDTLFVGAPNYVDVLANQGIVRAYTWNGTSFAPAGTPVAVGASNETLGYSLDLSGDRLIVGSDTGETARILERNAGAANSWTTVLTPTPSSPQAGEFFGRAVAISGPTAVIGSPFFDHPSGQRTGRTTVVELASQRTAVALDDVYSVLEGDVVVANLLTNDFDPNADPFQIQTYSLPSGFPTALLLDTATGALDLRATNSDDNGDLSFDYTLDSGSSAQVSVHFEPVNDPPVGVDDAPIGSPYQGLENVDMDVGVSVLANDTDVDEPDDSLLDLDVLEAVLVTDVDPNAGTLTFNVDGTWTFSPTTFWNGDAWFEYQPTDGLSVGNAIIVNLHFDGVNQAPEAVDHAFALDEDTLFEELPPGLLVGATDVETPPADLTLDVTLVTAPAHGVAVLRTSGGFSYTPDPDYYGYDSFEFAVYDGIDLSPPARVDLTIRSQNDAPIAVDDSFGLGEDPASPLVVIAPGLIDNDWDPDGNPLTASLISFPSKGNLNNFDPGTGSFEYDPDPDAWGLDSFVYEIRDPDGLTDQATVSLWIGPQNDPPVAVDDGGFAQAGIAGLDIGPVDGVLVNDFDVDGDSFWAILEDSPEHGSVELAFDGGFVYLPDPEYLGNDAFYYTISDGATTSNVAEVQLSVNTIGAGTGPGTTDTGAPGCTDVWYPDADLDGYGDQAKPVTACEPPEGTIAEGGDCDDSRSDIHPEAEEFPDDGIDQDCSGRDASFGAGGGSQCGCQSSGAPATGLVLLLLPLFFRRSRR